MSEDIMRGINTKVLALVIGVAAVAIIAYLITKRPPTTSEVTVAVILATSGPADFIGKPERAVLEAQMADYSREPHADPKIRLTFYDSQGDPGRALNIFQTVARDTSVIAIIGPSTSGESLAIVPEAERARIPLLSLAASRDIVIDEQGRSREWAFKFAQNDDLAAARLAASMLALGDTTVALLFSGDGFGKSGANVMKSAIEQTGILRLVHEAQFPATITQPEPLVGAVPKDADAVVVWSTAPSTLVVKALRQSRHGGRIYLSHGNATHEFVKSTGSASEGVVVVGSRVLLAKANLSESIAADMPVLRYQRSWEEKNLPGSPSHFGGHARDALDALVLVLQTNERSRRGVRDGLEKLGVFHGVTGTFRFSTEDHAGLTTDAFATYQIQSAGFTQLRAEQ